MLKVLIVGLGVIGASLAQALSMTETYEVFGTDCDESVCEKAIALGRFMFVDVSFHQWLKDMDLVVLCMPPDQMVSWVEANQMHMKKNAILSDVAGIKVQLIKDIEAVIRDDVAYVSIHPMAGSEGAGIDRSNPYLFRGTHMLLVKSLKSTHASLEALRHLSTVLDFATCTLMTPEAHDLAITKTSQMPHLLAMVLTLQEGIEDAKPMMGGSFKDMIRIADFNEPLWASLFLRNKVYLLEAIEAHVKLLEKIKVALESESSDWLIGLLRQSRNIKKYLEDQ